MGIGVANATPRPIHISEKNLGIAGTGGWAGPRNELDGCLKYHTNRKSISRPSSQYRVAISTTLAHKLIQINIYVYIYMGGVKCIKFYC